MRANSGSRGATRAQYEACAGEGGRRVEARRHSPLPPDRPLERAHVRMRTKIVFGLGWAHVRMRTKIVFGLGWQDRLFAGNVTRIGAEGS